MTPAELTVLAAELRGDPLGLGYAVHLPDDPQRVVDLMSQPDYTVVRTITTHRALTWAASGPMASIVDTSSTHGHAARSSCLAFLYALNLNSPIALGDSRVRAMFDGWLASGVIDQDAHDALLAMAGSPATRADVLAIPAPTARDIIDAWGVQ